MENDTVLSVDDGALALHRRVLVIGLALTALLFVLPWTNWILLKQVSLLCGNSRELAFVQQSVGIGMPNDGNPTEQTDSAAQARLDIKAAAEANPSDRVAQLGYADLAPDSHDKLLSLVALAKSEPDNPAVYAHILRFASAGDVRCSRPVEESELQGKHSQTTDDSVKPSKAEELSEYLDAAAKGEQLDPNNAYFPTMAAVGLFAAHHDADAIAALERAGMKTGYREYIREETDAVEHLRTLAYGRQDSMERIVTEAAILFPDLSQVRAMAQIATYTAMQDETSGDAARGVEIRESLMRIGGLMRAEPESAIHALVGIAIVGIAAERTGGSPAIEFRSTDGDKVTAERRDAYVSYLTDHQDAREAAWASAEFKADDAARSIISAGLNTANDTMIRGLLALAISWCCGLALLANLIWFAITAIGGLATAPGDGSNDDKRLWIVAGASALAFGIACLAANNLAAIAGVSDDPSAMVAKTVIWGVILGVPVVSVYATWIALRRSDRDVARTAAAIGSWGALSVSVLLTIALIACACLETTTMKFGFFGECNRFAQEVGRAWPGLTK
jgi:hypothetical protein